MKNPKARVKKISCVWRKGAAGNNTFPRAARAPPHLNNSFRKEEMPHVHTLFHLLFTPKLWGAQRGAQLHQKRVCCYGIILCARVPL